MGVHIIPYKIIDVEEYYGNFIDIVERIIPEPFDSIRMAGDDEFITDNNWTYVGYEKEYVRPKVIQEVIDYCKDKKYQKRFIPYLINMSSDESLVFKFAY